MTMRPPRATYRLQFSRDFGFADAARLAPYLSRLGVSHVYASPYLRARPGSTHGYDIVAHDELNPELGDAQAWRHMVAEFERHDLGQILDFVPNHMGVGGADNPLWLNVLEWGRDSPYAGWFDIDWEPAAGYLAEKLLVPILGEQYGAALDAGNLRLRFDAVAGEFAVWAYDTHKLPIHPPLYGRILGTAHPALERLGDEFSALPEWRPQIERRARELKSELALLVASDAAARRELEASLDALNGTGVEADGDADGEVDGDADAPARAALHALIQRQHWRASHFRVAGDDINYRRFFNVNDLAGLRMELPDVFDHAHRLVARLLRDGAIDGLRIDHIDGLLDPGEYLARLRALALDPNGASVPFHLVVEKILARDEPLPLEWPVEGTTGYEFANLLLRTLTHPGGEAALTRAYTEHTGETQPFPAVVRDGKLRILRDEMASELQVLARDTARVARQNARTADFTRNLLRRAIRATIACFPVYRTYLDSRGTLTARDRSMIARAIAAARGLERDVDSSVFDFLESLLTGDLVAAPRSGFSRHAALRCAMKFQQLSGPVMAKGLEDTAFYRYNRSIAHNEVGGDPSSLSATLEEFHAANAERLRVTPHGLLGTSTHDTKRGEDVRARLAALAELPDEWSGRVLAWRLHVATESASLGDRNLEYFLWQTLVGSWPCDAPEESALASYRDRVHAALTKAAREARVNTSWAAPQAAFEGALRTLIDAIFAADELRADLAAFATRLARAGHANGLVQTALKLTVPGVPDLYQGAELWDLSLVDPDNRRPVDFARRAALLESTLDDWRREPAATVRRLAASPESGAIKLLTIAVLLDHRRADPARYARGAYLPIEAPSGCGAFERRGDAGRTCVVFRRFPLASPPPPALPLPGVSPSDRAEWHNLLTGETLHAGQDFTTASAGLPFVVAVTRDAAAPRATPPG